MNFKLSFRLCYTDRYSGPKATVLKLVMEMLVNWLRFAQVFWHEFRAILVRIPAAVNVPGWQGIFWTCHCLITYFTLFIVQTEITTRIRRTAVRETGAFRHCGGPNEDTTWNNSNHHSTIILRALRQPLIGTPIYPETSVCRTPDVILSTLVYHHNFVIFWTVDDDDFHNSR